MPTNQGFIAVLSVAESISAGARTLMALLASGVVMNFINSMSVSIRAELNRKVRTLKSRDSRENMNSITLRQSFNVITST